MKIEEYKETNRKLKYESRRCEIEPMDNISKDLVDTARLHNM